MSPKPQSEPKDQQFDPRVIAVAHAIANAEGGASNGSNNPGSLSVGDVGAGLFNSAGVTQFPDIKQGWNRLYKQVSAIMQGDSKTLDANMSILDFAKKWTGNDHADSWASHVASFIGFPVDSKINDLLDISSAGGNAAPANPQEASLASPQAQESAAAPIAQAAPPPAAEVAPAATPTPQQEKNGTLTFNGQQYDLPTAPVTLEPSDETKIGITDNLKHYWRNVSQIMNTSALEPLHGFLAQQNDGLAQIVANEQAHNHPGRALLAGSWLTTQSIVEKILFGLTTPTSMALILSGNPELSGALKAGEMTGTLKAVKASQAAANLYFGYRGAESALRGKMTGESEQDYRERQFLSGLQVAATGIGLGSAGKDFIVTQFQSQQGLSGNLSEKVATKLKNETAIRQRAEFNAGTVAGAADTHIQELQAENARRLDITKAELAKLKRQVNEVTFSAAKNKAEVKAETTQKIRELEAEIKSQQAVVDRAIPPNVDRLKALATEAVEQARADVSRKFGEAVKLAKRPVTSVTDMRAEITNSFTDNGMASEDIPAAAFDHIPEETGKLPVRPPTTDEKLAQQTISNSFKQGMSPQDIRGMLLAMSYDPRQIDILMKDTGVAQGDQISFEDLTKIKSDLFSLLQKEERKANPDADMVRSLISAWAKTERMANQHAVLENLGDSNHEITIDGKPKKINKIWSDANYNYMRFKRELGVGEMADFIYGKDVTEQALLGDTAKMMTPANSEVIRKLLKVAGIDTTPLDTLINTKVTLEHEASLATDAIKEMAAEKLRNSAMEQTLSRQELAVKRSEIVSLARKDLAQMKASIGDEQSAAAEQSKKIIADAEKAIDDMGKEGAIIPKRSDLTLKGKSTIEIRREAMKEIAENMKQAGIRNPYGLMQVLVGVIQVSAQSIWGVGRIMLGGSRVAPAWLVHQQWFQDWIVDEAGVDAENAAKFKRAISESGPPLEVAAKELANKFMSFHAAKSGAAGSIVNKTNQIIMIDRNTATDRRPPTVGIAQ